MEATDTAVEDAIADLGARGVRRFVFTPVEVDGTLAGPGLDRLGAVLGACEAAGAELIYSGGVGSLADLAALAAGRHRCARRRDRRPSALRATIQRRGGDSTRSGMEPRGRTEWDCSARQASGASGGGSSLVAEVALLAKRHLDKLGPGEATELRELLVKSKGRPGNLSSRERSRIKALVTKLEPGLFAKSAAMPFRGRKG